MHRRPSPICFLVLSLVFATAAFGQLSGRVVGVHDGDTLTVLDAEKTQHKIRLSAIDAPEIGQDFGQEAKHQLSDLTFGKTVMIEGNKIDRHGRRVAKVLINGRDANLEMVVVGLAWWYKDYQREQSSRDREIYNAAEADARSRKLGLWSTGSP